MLIASEYERKLQIAFCYTLSDIHRVFVIIMILITSNPDLKYTMSLYWRFILLRKLTLLFVDSSQGCFKALWGPGEFRIIGHMFVTETGAISDFWDSPELCYKKLRDDGALGSCQECLEMALVVVTTHHFIYSLNK